MLQDKTEYEWVYLPADYFEAQYYAVGTGYTLVAEGGRVLVTLNSPQAPVDSQLDARLRQHVTDLFAVRELQVHRPHTLKGPCLSLYRGGQKTVALQVQSTNHVVTSENVDLIQRGPNGNIVRDTKAERIAEETRVLDAVTPRLAQSSVLRAIVTSYSNAVSDPDDELVHLYEIRDALASHFGNARAAQSALGISRREWDRLGTLANVEPLRQGRHRGEHAGVQRAATEAELSEARALVSDWILKFAVTI